MKKIKRFYKKYNLAIDFLLAFAVTLFVIICDQFGWLWAISSALADNRVTLYATFASIAGSLIGFLLTAVSVVIVFGESPRFQILRESSYYGTIFSTYFQAIGWLGALTAWSFVAIFGDTDVRPVSWITYVEIGLIAVSVVRTLNCIRILWAMTRIAIMPIPDAVRRREAA